MYSNILCSTNEILARILSKSLFSDRCGSSGGYEKEDEEIILPKTGKRTSICSTR